MVHLVSKHFRACLKCSAIWAGRDLSEVYLTASQAAVTGLLHQIRTQPSANISVRPGNVGPAQAGGDRCPPADTENGQARSPKGHDGNRN